MSSRQNQRDHQQYDLNARHCRLGPEGDVSFARVVSPGSETETMPLLDARTFSATGELSLECTRGTAATASVSSTKISLIKVSELTKQEV